jgi:hypothetical protein
MAEQTKHSPARHSRESGNPGQSFVDEPFDRLFNNWMPAYAGMTNNKRNQTEWILDSRMRGHDR